MIIKKIRPLSLAKIMGCLYGAVGLIFGVIFALASLVGAGVGFAASNGEPGMLMGMLFGVGAVVFVPLFYGGLAFLMGLLIAALYNLVAGFVGGIEVEVEHPAAAGPIG